MQRDQDAGRAALRRAPAERQFGPTVGGFIERRSRRGWRFAGSPRGAGGFCCYRGEFRLAIYLGLASVAHAWDWHPGDGCRWAELPVPKTGQTGFTLLPPERTGICFTNRLSEEAAANNRILQNGSGVALGDVDGDGRCDLFFCSLEGTNALYRNLGNWRFEDITVASGLAVPIPQATGAVFADVDGDGDLDLLVNSIGGGTRLFLNDGHGHFTEAPEAGLRREFGATSMALADIDGDGTLDLYVTTYRTTSYKDRPPGVKVQARLVDGRMVVTPADRFIPLFRKGGAIMVGEKGEPDFLYRNDGQGHFSPVSWTDGTFRDEAGQPLQAPPKEWGLSVMFRDLNGDGAPDIYVCNDFLNSRDEVWINDGTGRFRAIDRQALRNMSMSSMSVDFADINRDGHDDFFVADMLSR
ncbi:MAG: VCBS repeat-containing protein, partial [Verrucomicrobia bacterium]|nr:VCBS repeat-containing protein [Verrucomicrobiota bacterium]